MSRPVQDLTGRVFGFLKVTRRGPGSTSGATWHVRCECGNVRTVRASALLDGKTRSCGCLRRAASQERMRKMHVARKNETRYSLDEVWAEAKASAAAKLAKVNVRFET